MPTVVERFWQKVHPEPNSGCWIWLSSLHENGYGEFWYNGTKVRAVRFSYEQSKGPIPRGTELDHLCRVRACVNPDHVEAVTHQENMRRRRAFIMHCPAGHPYALFAYHWRGKRFCRRCMTLGQRERRQRHA